MKNKESNISSQLEKLGLTAMQARIYLTLHNLGRGKILTISRTANIDRSNTYRTILQLESYGLVAKIIDIPIEYQAIPLKKTVLNLLAIKKNQFGEIECVANRLMNIEISNKSQTRKEHEFKMIKLTKEAEEEEIISRCRNIQQSNDLLINRKTFLQGIIELAPAQLACIRRGIKFRVITERITSQAILEKVKPFVLEANFEIRYIDRAPEVEVVINDEKLAYLMLNPNAGLGERTMLIVDHPGCVEMFQSHFDKKWKQACY